MLPPVCFVVVVVLLFSHLCYAALDSTHLADVTITLGHAKEAAGS